MTPQNAAAPKPRPASLDPMLSLVASDMERVTGVMLDKLRSEQAPLITDLAGYVIKAGGKRIRPALTLACAQLCGYRGDRHVHLAACVEFIHTATLLHDDVIDESAMRRGRPTAHEVWDNTSSVLVGDYLFSRAFQLMVADGSLEVLRLLSDASATISEGEVKQLMVAHDVTIDEATNLQVIEAKTSALFAAACEIGGVICDDTAAAEKLRAFGHYLGIAFQLTDDVLDYSAAAETLGKSIGDDMREGKITLPIIITYARASEPEKAFLKAVFSGDESADAGALKRITALMHRYDALAQTLQRARSYGEKAQRALQHFASCPMKEALSEAVDFTTQRAY